MPSPTIDAVRKAIANTADAVAKRRDATTQAAGRAIEQRDTSAASTDSTSTGN